MEKQSTSLVNGDIQLKDDGKFWGFKATPITEAGKQFAYLWNNNLHKKTFQVMHGTAIDRFTKLALQNNLVIETIL